MWASAMGALRVKICGMTRVQDARNAADLGVDAIGINFYPVSPRFVSVERAIDIADSVRGRVELFGVFVNDIPERVDSIIQEVGLDRVQFHGDEAPEALERFGSKAVKAVRFERSTVEFNWGDFPYVGGFLLEPRHETLYGGSGRSWNYRSLRGLEVPRPWLLAGGLSPENVASAIAESGAPGVDVCSGVESIPGIKDARRMEAFVREVRRAEEAL